MRAQLNLWHTRSSSLLFLLGASLATALLLLLSEELSNGLEPVPLALDKASRLVHVLLLLDLFILGVILFLFHAGEGFAPRIILCDELLDLLVFVLGVLGLVLDIFPPNFKFLKFALALPVALSRNLPEFTLVFLQVSADCLSDLLLGLQLLLEVPDLLLHLGLLLRVHAVLAQLSALNLPLHVLDVQLGVHFDFVDGLFHFLDFGVFLGLLLGRLVSRADRVLSDDLNVQVQLLFFLAQRVVFLLAEQVALNVTREGFELQIGGQLLLHQLHPLHQVTLVFLYLALVPLYVGVVLELLAQAAGRLLKVFSDRL